LAWSSERWFDVLVRFTALVVALALLWIASIAGLQVYRGYNEGWNAYHALAAVTGGALYPRPPSLMVNNYPPLSFFIVGGVGRFVGDMIVAGRIVSLVSTLVAGWAVFAIARRMGAGAVIALFAALLFLAKLLAASTYIGINDPQMLGHAFGCLGFLAVLGEPRNTHRIALGALLLTLAVFVKHMLIIQPLVLLIWLLVFDRTSAIKFAAFGLLFAALGYLICRIALGIDLFAILFSPRSYRIEWVSQSLADFLLVSFAPLGAGIYLLKSKERYALLCGLYTVLAFAIGLAFDGGAGVGRNALFDAAIGGALSAAILVRRLPPRWALVFAAACLVPAGVAGAQRFEKNVHNPIGMEAAATQFDISYLREQPGPALCEKLSLCYWAGKRAEVDVFNFVEAVDAGTRDESELIHLLDRRYFSTVELDAESRLYHLPAVRAALKRNYMVGHVDEYGLMLTRAAPAL
jgi:hypothetical protein